MVSALGTIPASEKIGSFPWWDWVINASPGRAFLIMALISPIGIMYILRPLVEGRLLRLRDDFWTFKLEILLAAAFALGLVLVRDMDNRVYVHRNLSATLAQVCTLVVWAVIGIWHMWREWHEYDWKQRLSPAALYHSIVLYVFLGYSVTTVCALGMIFAPFTVKDVIVRLLMAGAIAIWVLAWPLWDVNHREADGFDSSVSKYDLVYLDDAWPWQHRYRFLWDDIKTFLKDLAGLPRRMVGWVR